MDLFEASLPSQYNCLLVVLGTQTLASIWNMGIHRALMPGHFHHFPTASADSFLQDSCVSLLLSSPFLLTQKEVVLEILTVSRGDILVKTVIHS